jgi:hypothetical protein
MIRQLTQEKAELRKECHPCTASMRAHESNTLPEDIAKILKGDINYSMNAMLERHETLDEESKNEFLPYAISSGNEKLQTRLLLPRETQGKTGTSLAQLTEEIIELAHLCKVPE